MQPNATTGMFAGIVVAVSSAQANIIYVDDDACPGPGSGIVGDPYCSIQTAIVAAASGVDVVEVAPGTYFETIDFLGKAITLQSSGGAGVTTIDGTGFFHVVRCVTGEGPDTVLDGFTITGGNANGLPTNDRGGGMYNVGSNPTVTDCTFIANLANFGGGMFNDASSPALSGCNFEENMATGGSGGGMFNQASSPTMTGCTFETNSATSGGGMYNDSTSGPMLTNCLFSENMAVSNGGGMNNIPDSTPTLIGCTFRGNWAHIGGGMSNNASSPAVTNCLFDGNSATFGGGISNSGDDTALTNCTFSGNSAINNGGGLRNGGQGTTVVNCIFWDDLPQEIINTVSGTLVVSYSDVEGSGGSGAWDPSFGTDGGGNIDADPWFVDPDNGDFRLGAGSPCIDAGDNTAPGLVGITTDLDGHCRFANDLSTTDTGNGECPIVDMGAYEFPSSCPWDLNCDGNVGIEDFLWLLADWGTDPGCPPDFDGDGVVGITDFLKLLANWGPC